MDIVSASGEIFISTVHAGIREKSRLQPVLPTVVSRTLLRQYERTSSSPARPQSVTEKSVINSVNCNQLFSRAYTPKRKVSSDADIIPASGGTFICTGHAGIREKS